MGNPLRVAKKTGYVTLSVSMMLLAVAENIGSAASIVPKASADKIAQYETLRADAKQVTDHWELAQWCQRHDLHSRARAHATMVVRQVPDHAAARRLLDQVRVGTRWVDADQLVRERESAEQLAGKLRRYRTSFVRMNNLLSGTDGEKKLPRVNRMLARFLRSEHSDLLTHWAINGEDLLATQIVDWLAETDDSETTLALARLAVWDQRQGLRQIAGKALQTRDLRTWVPTLIQWCEGKMSVQHDVLTSPDGEVIGVARVITRDEGDQQHVTHHRTEVVKVGPAAQSGIGRRVSGVTPAARDAQRMLQIAAQADQSELNDLAWATNQRVDAITSRVVATIHPVEPPYYHSDETQLPPLPLDATVDQLRAWWYQLNDSTMPAEKEVVPTLISNQYTQAVGNRMSFSLARVTRSQQLAERAALQAQGWIESASRPSLADPRPSQRPQPFWTRRTFTPPMDCLVKGTLIQTDRGLRDIAQLTVGDQVLSVDMSNGQLAYRSVLDHTEREPIELLMIQLGDETMTCSPGHHFWVEDQGWKAACRLVAGDRLRSYGDHTNIPSEQCVVVSIQPHGPAPTFNLSIDGNHNYLIGKQGVFSHDLTFHAAEAPPVAAR